MLAEGRGAYRLRKPRKNGATHLVMTPVELLAKIASVVPPPRRPRLRLSGVLGPKSSWRASVVPGGAHAARHGHADRGAAMPFGVNDTTGLAHAGDAAATCASAEDKAKPVHAGNAAATGRGGTVGAHAGGDVAMTGGEDKTKPAPGRASARSERGKGVVRPQGVRIDWASLLQRVFLEDVLACPCGGRRRIVCDVQACWRAPETAEFWTARAPGNRSSPPGPSRSSRASWWRRPVGRGRGQVWARRPGSPRES